MSTLCLHCRVVVNQSGVAAVDPELSSVSSLLPSAPPDRLLSASWGEHHPARPTDSRHNTKGNGGELWIKVLAKCININVKKEEKMFSQFFFCLSLRFLV